MQDYNIKDFNNFYVHNLMQAGPDFLVHTWHAIIIADDDTSHSIFDADTVSAIKNQNETLSNTLTSNALAVRIQNFTIPQAKYQTGTVNYGYRTITKMLPTYTQSKKLNLEIALDQNMYLFDIFMMASNAQVYRTIKATGGSQSPTIKYLDALLPVLRNRRQTGKVYNSSRIANYDIAVLHSLAVDDSSNLFVWIFKDVHFLGRSNAIDLDNTSANNLSMTIPFTYKRMYQLTDTSQLVLPEDAKLEASGLISGYNGEIGGLSSFLA